MPIRSAPPLPPRFDALGPAPVPPARLLALGLLPARLLALGLPPERLLALGLLPARLLALGAWPLACPPYLFAVALFE